MEINYVDPPNRPMTQTFLPATIPTMHKDTIFLDFANNGNLLVGSCDVTASYWQGSFQVFDSFEDYNQSKHISYYNGSIIFDGKFLDSDKIIVSESEYKLKILTAMNETRAEPATSSVLECVEHCEQIKHIALWDKPHCVITSSDNQITLWDTNSVLKLCTNFTDYHTNYITGIDTKKTDIHMFVSVSSDRRACLWDTRTEGIAMELYRNEFCSLNSVAWCPIDENIVIVGTQSGNLYMLDVKQPKDCLAIQHCYRKSINKLQFAKDHEQLAVVGNTNILQVYNCKGGEFNLSFKNTDKHFNYICDAKWDNDLLFTCGLNSQVIKHSYQSVC